VGDQEAQGEQRAFDVGNGGLTPVGPGPTSSFDATILDFGHYAGHSIDELAGTDPDYLRWLARHPSGARYRTQIERVLDTAVPRPGDWQR
jgi:hypothetical protein